MNEIETLTEANRAANAAIGDIAQECKKFSLAADEHFKIKQRAVVQNVRYRNALMKIRDMDYRGNRSTESQIAFEALNE